MLQAVPCLRLLVASFSVHWPGEILLIPVEHAGK